MPQQLIIVRLSILIKGMKSLSKLHRKIKNHSNPWRQRWCIDAVFTWDNRELNHEESWEVKIKKQMNMIVWLDLILLQTITINILLLHNYFIDQVETARRRPPQPKKNMLWRFVRYLIEFFMPVYSIDNIIPLDFSLDSDGIFNKLRILRA